MYWTKILFSITEKYKKNKNHEAVEYKIVLV